VNTSLYARRQHPVTDPRRFFGGCRRSRKV